MIIRHDRGVRSWGKGPLAAVTVASGATAAGALEAARRAADAVELQFAGSDDALTAVLADPDNDVARHLALDVVFLVLLAVALVGFVQLVVLGPGGPHRRFKRVHWWLVLGPLGLDLAEDALLLLAHRGCTGLAPAIEVVAGLKWIGFAALVAWVVTMVAIRWMGAGPWPDPEARPLVDDVRARWDAHPGGRGIALSGGGIRSAAFALGGLTALGNDTVRSSRYLSAASGGAYMAAAMTHHAVREGQPGGALPFGDGSPELTRLRARSSWMVLNGRDGRIGIFRALASIAFNLLVLWLVVFALARPVGWLISSEPLHPELLARTPLLDGASLDREVHRADLRVDPAAGCELDDGCDFLVEVSERAVEARVAPSREGPVESDPRSLPVTFAPGVVHVEGRKASVVVQPRAAVDLDGLVDSRTDEPRPALVEVTHQLELELDADSVAGDDAAAVAEQLQDDLLRVADQPRLEQQTGFRGRAPVEIEGWMVALPAALLAVAVLAVTVVRRGATTELRWWASTPLALAGASAAVLVVAPIMLQWLPSAGRTVARLLPGVPDLVPGDPGGFGVWVAAVVAAGQSVRSLLKRVRPGPGGGGGSPTGFLLKGLVLVLLAGVGLALVVAVLQQAALNGPNGRLAGLGAMWWFPGLADVPDLGRWAIAVAALGLLALVRPAHHWSFQPLYRDRLAEAFSLTDVPVTDLAERKRAQPVDLPISGVDVPEAVRWPELLICAAVNLNDTDPASRIPAGRWAGSFTFSPLEIGGPDVGYLSTFGYERRLSPLCQRDISLPSLVAVSGAAFSPAMGKFGFGPIGGLFAVLNLRLGVWLPNPAWLGQRDDPAWWRRRPGWTYLLREVFGRYHRYRPFLYVTDGGHWENLGLVELFRRRCTEIVVVSAAGDGTRSFATIGEALALAREQCGVEVTIDLTPMRAPLTVPPEATGRQLLRRNRGGDVAAEAVAPRSYAVGWFTYPAGPSGAPTRGRLLVVEANLGDDLPWDVHAYAEGQPIFPDDPTTDQFFDHRQFESYRRLGEHQVGAGWQSAAWLAAGRWVAGEISDEVLRAAVADPLS